MRILLVEDDVLIGDGVRAGLEQEGYIVEWLENGLDAAAALEGEPFDALVLDLGLPGLGGKEILRALRERRSDMPVLILTARDTREETVEGLDLGADDYLVKPFDISELFARLRAIIRRASGRSWPVIQREDLTLDPASHRVMKQHNEIKVSRREFNLLRLLLENQGRVMSRDSLERRLYGWNGDVESNVLEVHVHNLRKKLGNDVIQTVRGVGYMIDKVS